MCALVTESRETRVSTGVELFFIGQSCLGVSCLSRSPGQVTGFRQLEMNFLESWAQFCFVAILLELFVQLKKLLSVP